MRGNHETIWKPYLATRLQGSTSWCSLDPAHYQMDLLKMLGSDAAQDAEMPGSYNPWSDTPDWNELKCYQLTVMKVTKTPQTLT